MTDMFVGFSPAYLIGMLTVWILLALCLLVFVKYRPWKSSRRRVQFLARCFLAGWSTLVFGMLMESVFAFLYVQTDSFGLTNSAKRWHRLHVTYNGKGFRDAKNFSNQIPEGKIRLALLGDSFTFGHGIRDVSDRFGDILERRGNELLDGRFEVYNLSDQGWDTSTEITTLRRLVGEGLQVDVVVLVYCLNDIEWLVPGAKDIPSSIIDRKPSFFLLRDTYLPNFLFYRWTQFRRPEFRDYFGWLKDGYRGQPWIGQQQRFDSLRSFCDEHDIELMVVVFPFLHKLAGEYPFEAAHQALAEYWSTPPVPYLDLLETMRARAGEGLVVNRFDAHPNERAHALAADAIWEHLLAERLQEMDRRKLASSDDQDTTEESRSTTSD